MGEVYHSLAMMYYCYRKHNDWGKIVSESHARMEKEKKDLLGKQLESSSEM
jgi:hypothetical protein